MLHYSIVNPVFKTKDTAEKWRLNYIGTGWEVGELKQDTNGNWHFEAREEKKEKRR